MRSKLIALTFVLLIFLLGVFSVSYGESFDITNQYTSNKANNQYVIHYFGTNACQECLKTSQFFEELTRRNPSLFNSNTFILKKYEVSNKVDGKLHKDYSFSYNVTKDKFNDVPIVFFNDTYYHGLENIKTNLEKDLWAVYSKQLEYAPPEIENYDISSDEGQLNSISLTSVFLAGLLDGVNPCAMAMLLFFGATLISVKKSSSDILKMGFSYITGVFIVYLGIGIGILKVALIVNVADYIILLIYSILVLGLFILSVQSFREFLSLKDGGPGNVKLQLSKKQKSRIHKFIKKYANSKYLIVGGFFIGAVVSVMEFFCTGQVYLPTIMYLLNDPSLMEKGLFYLVVYNISFTIPLFIILLISIKQNSIMDISFIVQERIYLIKLLTSIFFFIVAIYFGYQIILMI